ncbi:diguanylate cyclase [Albimonas pacifica]|uniref:diguanylate cyclase n=1 Tax=Albimonas pacifica TaxID=1114924 RepID=A0A1I3HMA9_9RHOB|nr:diguanylate cyclase [Albimonas pacifica]SFI36821.1 response regulator receiver modulated diguanylate cyclase [Albimonas pacifica]
MPGRILIAGGPAVQAHRLAERLSDAFLAVRAGADGRAALAHALAHEPDLVIADARAGGLPGLALCRALKGDAALQHVPLLIAGSGLAPGDRLAALEAGADDVLALPVDDGPLLARLRNLLRVKAMVDELRARERTARSLGLVLAPPGEDPAGPDIAAAPGDLLLVRGDAAARRRGAQLAAGLGFTVRRAADGRTALEMVDAAPPELVLIEPDPDRAEEVEAALRLVAALRARPAARQAGVLAALPAAAAATALDLGASDCVAAPADLAELGARLRTQLRRKRCSDRLRDAVRQGLEMAVTDPLTGLFNRRYAETHLAAMIAQCAAAGQPLSLMLLDLDRFKQINDRHGHPAGDAVLRGFAARLRAAVRGVDLVARIGGEEFCVALPGADAAEARGVAERVRAAVAAEPFPAPEGPPVPVTVSIGVAVAQAGAAAREPVLAPPAAPPALRPCPEAPPCVAGMAEARAAFQRPPAPRLAGACVGAAGLALAAIPDAAPHAPGGAVDFGASRLMALADAALYRSKSQGRDRVSFAPF